MRQPALNFILNHVYLIWTGNGQCECGMCQCESGYNGTTCDCSTSIDTCTNSKTVSPVINFSKLYMPWRSIDYMLKL